MMKLRFYVLIQVDHCLNSERIHLDLTIDCLWCPLASTDLSMQHEDLELSSVCSHLASVWQGSWFSLSSYLSSGHHIILLPSRDHVCFYVSRSFQRCGFFPEMHLWIWLTSLMSGIFGSVCRISSTDANSMIYQISCMILHANSNCDWRALTWGTGWSSLNTATVAYDRYSDGDPASIRRRHIDSGYYLFHLFVFHILIFHSGCLSWLELSAIRVWWSLWWSKYSTDWGQELIDVCSADSGWHSAGAWGLIAGACGRISGTSGVLERRQAQAAGTCLIWSLTGLCHPKMKLSYSPFSKTHFQNFLFAHANYRFPTALDCVSH